MLGPLTYQEWVAVAAGAVTVYLLYKYGRVFLG